MRCLSGLSKIARSTALLFFVVWISIGGVRRAFAAEHAGNVFVAGDEVSVAIPTKWAGWRAIDVEGKEVGHGAGSAEKAELGKLPVGYFEVLEKDGPGKIMAGVVAKNEPTEDTPIALDASMSWFYPDNPQQIRDACTLCRLAGVKWVRDRLSWPEMEPERGKFAGETRYERTMRLEHEMGLKILQVNHISPPWAEKNATHFPDDLRDVYNFYHGLAKRWNRLADAIEPWNEPDIEMFGGHTGCEIASFQKAAYLGLKAGDPKVPVCEAVFAIDRAETLDEFGANEVYPYFDLYDLHHYVGLDAYPRAYGRHREVSGGRPMWTTEFNLMVNWADAKTQEPSEEDLRVQGYRVSKVFATALNEGADKLFYFILGHYVERTLQYGLVHADLTPRPAYVAFAAVGRLLNDAKPLGRVNLGDDKLKGYVFATQVDGTKRETLVAWSETKPTNIEIRPAEKAYDYLGRELPSAKKTLLTRSPVFFLLPSGGSRELKIDPPPVKAKWLAGKPGSVVLQLLGHTDFKQSAFVLGDKKQLQLVAYNFGEQAARGTLSVQGGTSDARELEIAPGGRTTREIAVDAPGELSVTFDSGKSGHAMVSARIVQGTSP
jgi:hypothetical protein